MGIAPLDDSRESTGGDNISATSIRRSHGQRATDDAERARGFSLSLEREREREREKGGEASRLCSESSSGALRYVLQEP